MKAKILKHPILGPKLNLILKFAVDASVKRSKEKRQNKKCAPCFNALILRNKLPSNFQKDSINSIMYHNYAELSEDKKDQLRKQIHEFPVISMPKEIRWSSLFRTLETILERFQKKIVPNVTVHFDVTSPSTLT